jgi:hypothetical protein
MILSDAIAPKIVSAEGEALCRVRGPRIWGMQQRTPEKGLYFLLKKGQTSYDDLRTMRE